MKFVVVIFGLVAAVSAQYDDGRYKPQIFVAPATTRAPVTTTTRAPVTVAKFVPGAEYNAETLKFGNENDPDGSYNYFYETSNGIAAQEQGTPSDFGVVAKGSYFYTSPEGLPVAISYVADENGYQPSGDVLPTPPSIPAQIALALEYIAKNASKK